ncbi:MAG: Gfo/Idh/MocA family oxidoreductase [Planctomycetes bacterium]|nr:Gfo/Idh/MocA family oxidoreductase [Planctomycetota bacterium]
MGAITRRDFIKSMVAAGTVMALPSAHVLGANDRIRVGLIGCGGRGTDAHLPGFAKQPGVVVVAVSDPDQQRRANAAKIAESKYGSQVEQYADMRKLLDRKDIDVIANATQNYWHGLSTIWACQAGKHIYVEKPLSHYIWEGRQMVNAARKYHRIAQCGTQHRSEVHFAQPLRPEHPMDSRGPSRQDQVHHGVRQQAPLLLRQARHAPADSRERRLRPLVRPGQEGAHLPEPTAI